MLSTSCLQLGQEQQRARSIPVHQIPVPVISPASTHARIQSMSSGNQLEGHPLPYKAGIQAPELHILSLVP